MPLLSVQVAADELKREGVDAASIAVPGDVGVAVELALFKANGEGEGWGRRPRRGPVKQPASRFSAPWPWFCSPVAHLLDLQPFLLLVACCPPPPSAGGLTKEYKSKFRSLVFNLKDAANPDLRARVLQVRTCPTWMAHT